VIPVVRASGTPRERGLAVGRGLAEPIARSAAFYERYFTARGHDASSIASLAAPYLAAAEQAVPDLVEVLRAMATGADVDPTWLVAANAFEELDPLMPDAPPPRERCTAFASVAPGGTILGHTEQWMAGDRGCVGLVVDDPGGDGIAVVSPVVASWLPAVGANAAGGAVSVMSLRAPDDGVGVPRVLVSRHALGSRDAADAVRRATLESRSGGYAYLWGWRDDAPLAVETTARAHAVVATSGHANHYLDPGLAAEAFEPSDSSRSRHARVCALVEAAPPVDLASALAILADHGADPPICRHPDPADGDEADCLVFAMVVDLGARELWVADGNPCEGLVDRFSIDELLDA
jgi:isopenicillin-N N-acyltransferase-like protein